MRPGWISYLRAEGIAGRAVSERKYVTAGGDSGRSGFNQRLRPIDSSDRLHRHSRRRQPDRRTPAVAISQAATLPRLWVGVVTAIGASRLVHRRMMSVMVRVCAGSAGLFDRKTAVHGAGVQLRRLDHTDGEPERQQSSAGSRHSGAAHRRNIWECPTDHTGGAADLAIRPRTAINIISVSGSHSSIERSVSWNHPRSTIPVFSACARCISSSVCSLCSSGSAGAPALVLMLRSRERRTCLSAASNACSRSDAFAKSLSPYSMVGTGV
jgi:hypothetical protein